ncbi:MAG: hypothetical protein ACP5EN_05880 [Rhodovulum sp.]
MARVIVMRDEEPAIADKVLGRADLTAPQRMVYVTEAPFVQWTKTLNAITGTAGTVQTLESIGGNN